MSANAKAMTATKTMPSAIVSRFVRRTRLGRVRDQQRHHHEDAETIAEHPVLPRCEPRGSVLEQRASATDGTAHHGREHDGAREDTTINGHGSVAATICTGQQAGPIAGSVQLPTNHDAAATGWASKNTMATTVGASMPATPIPIV